jgi:hypothetical protein
MMATWERDTGDTGLSNIHNVICMLYKGNFVHTKDTRLSDICDGYLGGIQAKQGLSNIHNVRHTQATQTCTRGISYMKRIQGYQIFMMATWERDI